MIHNRLARSWLIITALILLFPGTALAQGGPVQRLEINYVDPSAWPMVSLLSTAIDADGMQLGPSELTLEVFEDNRPVTGEVQITPERTGLAVVVLMDLSGSMTERGIISATRFADAQAEALDFVSSQLQDGDLVGVVGFATTIRPEHRLDLTPDRGQALNLIGQMAPEADQALWNTALWEASWTAFRMISEHPDANMRERIKRMRRAVVVFSDGNDTVSKGAGVPDLAVRARELHVSYHTVGLKSPRGATLRFDPPEDDNVKWLADQTFGSFFDYGDDARRAELGAFLDRLAGQGEQLRISYASRSLAGQHATRVVAATGGISQEAEQSWFGGGCKLVARITEPAAGAAYGCSLAETKVPVRVAVECLDGAPRPIDRVEFYDNGALFGAVEAMPFVQDWDPRNASPGNHTLTAVVHDAALGELLTTEPRAIQVTAPARPDVRIVAPAAGSTVVRSQTKLVQLEAEVTFPDGCTRPVTVRFLVNGVPLAPGGLTSPPYRATWSVGELPAGSYEIGAELLDDTMTRPVVLQPVAVTLQIPLRDRVLEWLRANWYIPALALGLLLLLILLLLTRRQVGTAVQRAAVRVRNTLVGRPLASAQGTLQGVRGPAQGRTFSLTGRINTVGRDPQACEVVIGDDLYMSGKHFRIEFNEQGGAFVVDAGSRHGTSVNGQPLAANQPVSLRGGERIRAGESEFEFQPASRSRTRMVQHGRDERAAS